MKREHNLTVCFETPSKLSTATDIHTPLQAGIFIRDDDTVNHLQK